VRRNWERRPYRTSKEKVPRVNTGGEKNLCTVFGVSEEFEGVSMGMRRVQDGDQNCSSFEKKDLKIAKLTKKFYLG